MNSRALIAAIGTGLLFWYATRRKPDGTVPFIQLTEELTAGVSNVVQRVIDYTLPRGIRNNNPGNIERTNATWRGMSADQSADPRFVVFDSPEYGIRAMTRIIRNYMSRGLTSVRAIINTWAPPTENDTDAYVRAVAAKLNVSPDVPISDAHLPGLIDAIIAHENGRQPYPMETIVAGINLERTA